MSDAIRDRWHASMRKPGPGSEFVAALERFADAHSFEPARFVDAGDFTLERGPTRLTQGWLLAPRGGGGATPHFRVSRGTFVPKGPSFVVVQSSGAARSGELDARVSVTRWEHATPTPASVQDLPNAAAVLPALVAALDALADALGEAPHVQWKWGEAGLVYFECLVAPPSVCWPLALATVEAGWAAT